LVKKIIVRIGQENTIPLALFTEEIVTSLSQ